MADKIYTKGIFFKEKEVSFGTVLKIDIKVEDFIAFLEQHKNENGYVKLDVLRSREVSDKGNTHYATVDTWKPSEGGGNGGNSNKTQQKRKPAPKQSDPDPDDAFGDGGLGGDDEPFA